MTDTCSRCTKQLVEPPSRVAFLCGPGGGQVLIRSTPYCPDTACRRASQDEADAAAIAKAVEAGVIDP